MARAKVAEKPAKAEAEVVLPPVEDGEMATVASARVLSKKTRPPAAYTEATLLASMEHAAEFIDNPAYRKVLRRTSGLGTPATQAATIEGLKDAGLIEVLNKKELWPTEKGERLIDWLPEDTYSIERTAMWENELAMIETSGDDGAFMSAVISEVDRMVGVLRGKAAPATRAEGAHDDGPPTEKMLAVAKKICQEQKIRMPAGVKTSFQKCRDFLDTHISSAPSEKAVQFAQSIAVRKGIAVPHEVLLSRSGLSKWIDENK